MLYELLSRQLFAKAIAPLKEKEEQKERLREAGMAELMEKVAQGQMLTDEEKAELRQAGVAGLLQKLAAGHILSTEELAQLRESAS